MEKKIKLNNFSEPQGGNLIPGCAHIHPDEPSATALPEELQKPVLKGKSEADRG